MKEQGPKMGKSTRLSTWERYSNTKDIKYAGVPVIFAFKIILSPTSGKTYNKNKNISD